jgi:hypothetical protein
MPRKDPILLWGTGILIEARAPEIKPWLCACDSWDLELHFFLAVERSHKLFRPIMGPLTRILFSLGSNLETYSSEQLVEVINDSLI